MEGQTKTFIYPGAVVRVHFPDLTEEERNRRMKRIRKAAEDILKEKQGKERKIETHAG